MLIGDDEGTITYPKPPAKQPRDERFYYNESMRKDRLIAQLRSEAAAYQELAEQRAEEKDLPRASLYLLTKMKRQAEANKTLQEKIEKMKAEKKMYGERRMSAFIRRIGHAGK